MPGRSSVSGGPAKQGYTGHELDTESGLIYAGARYYIPGIGRWMGVDPLADKYPGWSPYNYVLNNPLRFVDPDGRAVSTFGGCPPNCDFFNVVGGFFDHVVNAVNTTIDGIIDQTISTAEVIVKEGPVVLDVATYTLAGTAVLSGTIALGTAWEPFSTITMGGVAVLTATGATLTNYTATGLSIIDALVFDGDPIEAGERLVLTVVAGAGGRMMVGAMSSIRGTSALPSTQRQGLDAAATAAGSTVVPEIVEEIIKD